MSPELVDKHNPHTGLNARDDDLPGIAGPWRSAPLRTRTPKQSAKQEAKYKYYAGFSDAFVADVLDRFASSGSRVLDPWNGSGTTTNVCAARGIASVGVDINPAMLPVAWARLADPVLVSRLCQQLERASSVELFGSPFAAEGDLLETYFSSRSAALLRSLRNHLVTVSAALASETSPEEQQAISGAAFVLLAEVLRDALRPLRGTNPSWFSRPRKGQRRISVNAELLHCVLSRAARALDAQVRNVPTRGSAPYNWPKLLLGDSRIDLTSLGTFDLAITSPPYCTRIDYAVATTPELLALGGIGERRFTALRKEIIGSVVTDAVEISTESVASDSTLSRTLAAIRQHNSKAASTYYARYFAKYFSDLVQSLQQLAGVVRHGHIVVVVQNSYFKEIKIDLAGIVVELMECQGHALSSSWEHAVRAPIAGSNPRFKIYRDSNVSTEHVLVFSTP